MKIKKKYYWLGAAILLILIVSGIIRAKTKAPAYKIAYTAANQDVKQTVVATGTVTSQSDLNLGFKNPGTLTKLYVNVGDKVRTGQTLAMLDQKDALASIKQAQGTLLAAQANYQKVINGAASADINVLQVALDNAKTSYTNTVQQQQTLVNNALSAMLNAGLTAIPSGIDSSTATISGTYIGTEQGQYNLNLSLFGGGLYYTYSGLESGSGNVNSGVPVPLGTKGLYVTFTNTSKLSATDTWTVSIPNTQSSTYLTYYNAYQSALQTQSQTVATAKGAVDAAQAALNQKVTPARPEDIAAAQAQVETAQAQLQNAQNTYSNNTIIAPIDGTITSVDSKIGELVTAQKEVIVLLDQQSLHVETDISESSISQVQQGQQVDMTFDAFGPDRHLTGTILSIDPAATASSGAVNYKVYASLPADPQIKPGMTVNMVIGIADHPDVLAIPNRLIKTNSSGQTYVTVLRGKTTQDVNITTGLQGDNFTEVGGGLQAGDQIVSNTTVQ